MIEDVEAHDRSSDTEFEMSKMEVMSARRATMACYASVRTSSDALCQLLVPVFRFLQPLQTQQPRHYTTYGKSAIRSATYASNIERH